MGQAIETFGSTLGSETSINPSQDILRPDASDPLHLFAANECLPNLLLQGEQAIEDFAARLDREGPANQLPGRQMCDLAVAAAIAPPAILIADFDQPVAEGQKWPELGEPCLDEALQRAILGDDRACPATKARR